VAALALSAAAARTAAASEAEPASRPGSVAVSGQGIGAVLSYREGIGGPLPYFDMKLQIAKPGLGTLYEQPVSSHRCPGGCVPEPVGSGPVKTGPLAIAALEANGQPEVLLGLSTGGAHCCTVLQVFSLDPGTTTFRPIEHDFGDPGVLLEDIDHNERLELRSADDRFAYEFAPYAYSGLPLQVWSVQEGRFENTTIMFGRQLQADAKRWLKAFRANRARGLGLGFIAAWAADEDMLGLGKVVRSTLAREAAHRGLRSHEGYGSSGRAFVSKLLRFLSRTGYAHAASLG
jgi:hypothetical protein